MKIVDKLTDMAEKMSPRKLLILCAGCAIIVFLIIYFSLSSLLKTKTAEDEARIAVTPVIEASQDIPPYTLITNDMVKVSSVPSDAVPAAAIKDMKGVVGKTSSVAILKGDVVTTRKINSQTANGFAGMIPKGMRAVSFTINDITGVSGFAKPGDKVDILLVGNKEYPDAMTSKLLLKDVLLLAVNKSSVEAQNASAESAENTASSPLSSDTKAPAKKSSATPVSQPAVATVAVTPYDAAKLTASAQMGILQLMLRPIGPDSDTSSVAYYVIPLPKENNAPQAESAQTAPRTPVQTSNGGQAAPAPARVSVDNNFDVLVNPDLLEEAYNMDISLIRTMIERLQLEYDYVIVDTTSTFSALNLSMMDLSTIIDFVGLVDFIPTIKNMKRGSDTLKELGYDDTKIRYVLNRSNARTRIDASDVEQILGKHFDYVLPNDFMTAQKSIQFGEPLVQKSRDTELAREICRIVDKYAKPGTEEEQDKDSKGGFFSRLFS